MTPRRATPADDALLTAICMDPRVKRWTSFDGAPAFDPAGYTAHPRSFAVIVESGCFLCPALEHRSYAVHTNFLRGALTPEQKREQAGAFLAEVFLQTDAEHLVTMVPANNPAAAQLARDMHFRDTFVRRGAWLWRGHRYDVQYLVLEIDDWVLSAPGLIGIGQRFHQALGEHATHAEDAVHERYVGAAWSLLQAGQVEKTVRLYGRWARAAGYQPFELLSLDPLRIDIGNAVLCMEGDSFTTTAKGNHHHA